MRVYKTIYGVQVILMHPNATLEHLGYIPGWLNEEDPTPAKEQLHRNYMHGGGWFPFNGFKLRERDFALISASDPPELPFAEFKLHNERIFMYDHSWVAIIQPDMSFEVCRMD